MTDIEKMLKFQIAQKMLRDPEDIYWIFENLNHVLGNAGLTSLLKDEEI